MATAIDSAEQTSFNFVGMGKLFKKSHSLTDAKGQSTPLDFMKNNAPSHPTVIGQLTKKTSFVLATN